MNLLSLSALVRMTSLALLAGACSVGSEVQPLRTGSTAEQYLAEFLEFEKIYPGGERSRSLSPDGTSEVFVQPARSLFSFGSCHEVIARTPRNPHRRVVRLRERDSGSGRSFGLGWSRDGRAAFLSGGHSGFGCPIREEGADLRVIFTLVDQVAWEVPSRG
jgi:hypothetical protein